MRKTVTRCDDCDASLSQYSNYEAWGLTLYATNFQVQPADNRHMEVIKTDRPIEREHHFCGLGCLESWLMKQEDDA